MAGFIGAAERGHLSPRSSLPPRSRGRWRAAPDGDAGTLTAIHRLVAPNPGPYTGPGTNTWIVDAGPVAIVIDPGPDDDAHLDAIEKRLGSTAVGVVLVTDSHPDHLPLAARLAARNRAAVKPYPQLAYGDVVRVGNLNVTALHTPGHSADHLSFRLGRHLVLF